MKISELIEQLNRCKEVYGDIQVCVDSSDKNPKPRPIQNVYFGPIDRVTHVIVTQ